MHPETYAGKAHPDHNYIGTQDMKDEVERTPEIHREMNTLSNSAMELAELVAKLEETFKSVLRETPPDNVKGSSTANQLLSTPMARGIVDVRSNIESSIYRLRNIIDRREI